MCLLPAGKGQEYHSATQALPPLLERHRGCDYSFNENTGIRWPPRLTLIGALSAVFASIATPLPSIT